MNHSAISNNLNGASGCDEKYSLLNRINHAIIVTGINGDILFINSLLEKMIGCDGKDVLNKKLDEILIIENDFNSATAESDISDFFNITNNFFLINSTGEKIPISFEASFNSKENGINDTILIVINNEAYNFNMKLKLRETLMNLKRTIDGGLQTIETIMELRDPYTAGHQRRVSLLSTRIGQQMNLTSSMMEGVRLAASMHDIGKISIPAEILSKPGKLHLEEFSLIKTHSQMSYDILSITDFPWPLAEIAYQHHERMDGSGYPRGLKGSDIMMEARIIAVADIVEAMVSHRPYRAALGVDSAIKELEDNTGTYYDPEVVHACLKIVREKNILEIFSI